MDAVTDESDTANNCSTSVQVTVPAPKPDLVVGSPTVDESSPATDAAFRLSVTVENDGGGAAASTTLRYYRSTDSTITTADTEVGTDSIDGLAATESGSRSVALTAPSTSWAVLLRGVRGRGDRRVGHDEQLLDVGAGDGTGAAAADVGTGGAAGLAGRVGVALR